MDKESIYELQKIDCNCNDCIFMIRNQEKYKESLARHERWQKDYFELIQSKNDEINKKFIFDKSTAKINYGFCDKLHKEVSFIPNILQLETQECFKHRKDV